MEGLGVGLVHYNLHQVLVLFRWGQESRSSSVRYED